MSVVLKRFKVPALLLALLWLVGCVQTKTLPGYARSGDFIVLGLGGIERNAGGEAVLKNTDLTIEITDANSVTYPIAARYVFKSYPNYAAFANSGTLDGQSALLGLTNLTPFDGGWFVVAPLTVFGTNESPLPLAVGPATVSVTSPKLTNIGNTQEGDLSAIPIEIIAGVSAFDNDYQRQFLAYAESGKSFLVSPNDLTGINAVGGAFLTIEYTDDSFFSANTEPMVVPLDHNPFVQLNYNHVPNGDGTGTLYVSLLNSAGFTTEAGASQNTSTLSNLGVKLLYFVAGLDPLSVQAKASFSIDAANSYYIGTDGSVLTGVSPVLTHYEDL
ncbi:MAG: hypothetical protein HRT77_15215 [Halioglobus sp.]|nr:hypothetical protein [Halioglobus sp.]